MAVRSEVFDRWWPLPLSLDLACGPTEAVAAAVLAELTRFVAPEPLTSSWEQVPTLDRLFGSVTWFTNVPTIFFVLPTRSGWSVLWDNSYLCDGYDSLCWNLTRNHGLTTCHWASSDKDAFFQAGTSFVFRRPDGDGMAERSVYCARNDGRWFFEAHGEPLSEEDLPSYAARRTRERLDEGRLMALLASLGARPWQEDFYALEEQPVFRVERTAPPASLVRRQFAELDR
jgi:hypothetical protein